MTLYRWAKRLGVKRTGRETTSGAKRTGRQTTRIHLAGLVSVTRLI